MRKENVGDGAKLYDIIFLKQPLIYLWYCTLNVF